MVHLGGLEAVHAQLRPDIEDARVGESVQDAHEPSQDVPLPHSVAEQGAAHVHVLVLAVDAHLKPFALRAKADGDTMDRLIHLHGRGGMVTCAAFNVM